LKPGKVLQPTLGRHALRRRADLRCDEKLSRPVHMQAILGPRNSIRWMASPSLNSSVIPHTHFTTVINL